MDSLQDMLDDMMDSNIPVGKKSDKVSLSSDLVSFKDCPNKCVDGFYINPYKHKRIRCEYCAEKRLALVKDTVKTDTSENLAELLNLPKSFTGYGNFSIDSVIPAFEKKNMLEDSVVVVSEALETLITDISAGHVSDYSIMFNLGAKAFENNFIYSYLTRAYLNGLVTSPYITDYDLCILRNKSEFTTDFDNIEFDKFINSEVCIVTIMAGATYSSIHTVKGLMQLRAHKGHSTIIFTNDWGRHIDALCTEDDVKCKNLAYLYSIKYDSKYLIKEEKYKENGVDIRKANSGVGLSSDAFNSLMGAKNSL